MTWLVAREIVELYDTTASLDAAVPADWSAESREDMGKLGKLIDDFQLRNAN